VPSERRKVLMHALLLQATLFLLVTGDAPRSVPPPREMEEKVTAFQESVQASKFYEDEIKKAVKAGADYYGKPYFLGSNFGYRSQHEYFTFGLFNPSAKPTCRTYSINPLSAGVQSMMKTVMFAFDHKVNWVAVYVRPDNPNQLLFIMVYP
jgi:hypothetical protein